jgi:hypothetical protein
LKKLDKPELELYIHYITTSRNMQITRFTVVTLVNIRVAFSFLPQHLYEVLVVKDGGGLPHPVPLQTIHPFDPFGGTTVVDFFYYY